MTVPDTTPSGNAPQSLPASIAKKVDQILTLHSMPQQTQKILAMLNTRETRLDEIAKEIMQDIGLSAQTLRIVNSSFYGIREPIGSVPRAVSMLGYGTMRNIVMMQHFVGRLGKNRETSGFHIEKYWDHSLWVAHVTYLLSDQTECGWPDEYFTAGLLHDMGKLVDYQYLSGIHRKVLSSEKKGEPYARAERRLMDTDHAQIGAYLCDKWNFPGFIVESVRHHLDPIDKIATLPLSREARIVAAVCNLSHAKSEEETVRWCELLQISTERLDKAKAKAAEMIPYSRSSVFSMAE